MKVSLSWLKEYTSVMGSPADIAAKLTMAGLEVDAVEDRFTYLDKVVVGRVDAVEKHPKADRLSCCRVDVGDETLSIVCGAPNVRAGLVVACARVGAVLPGDLVIKKSKLRGEVSQGMLCSATELRLGLDSSGIMELEQHLVPGTPLEQALHLSDTVLEIDLTPNRPDCLSIMGVAREVAAFSGSPFRPVVPVLPQADAVGGDISDYASVEIQEPRLCSRYTAAMVVDVTVGPSPFWLQDRLESVGLTPINNIVDVTNFVMMEMGQPLHAFDYDFLRQGKIVVKCAGTPQEFITLDSKPHTLDADMLMICDGEGPVGIAGVMGGENSEIVPKTTRVLIESACFDPVSIRRTAKLCGIGSDASHRFERGVDPLGCRAALERAAALMVELSGGSLVPGIIDENPVPFEPLRITLNTDALNRRLGTDLDDERISEMLTSVGFGVSPAGAGNGFMVDVPGFRVDVTRPEDLSEEVARLWGYDRIETRFPRVPSLRRSPAPEIQFRDRVREIMNGFGFSEAVNYSFADEGMCERLQLSSDDERWAMERILNPISEEMSVLRSSLLPGLMETMARNTARQTDTLQLFEVGNIFLARGEGIQPLEREMLAALWTGSRTSLSWHGKSQSCDFFDLKGVLEGLLIGLDIPMEKVCFAPASQEACPYLRKGCRAVATVSGVTVGSLGEVTPAVMAAFGLKQPLFIFEVSMSALLGVTPEVVSAQPLPRFPSLERDITIIVDGAVAAGEVCDALKRHTRENSLVEDVFLFDVYQGSPLAEGKKSLSFRIIYRAADRTLKEKKVRGVHSGISNWLVNQFKAALPV
jgi:phenylalanyl-tRNA synthetase beta chain